MFVSDPGEGVLRELKPLGPDLPSPQSLFLLRLRTCLSLSLGINTVSFFNFIYLFIYFWLRWVFIVARGLSLVAASGGTSSLQCVGFLIAVASLVVEHRL